MRAAVIEGGKVANIIEVASLATFPNLIDAAGGAIGDLWDGVKFSKPLIDLVAVRKDKWTAIKAERDRRKSAGVKVNIDATVGDKWFHSDDPSRIQQLGLVMMGASVPVGLQWKTMDGSFVTMTQALANKLFNACAAQDQAIFKKAEEHRAAMEAAVNPANYDFAQDAARTKWPVIFGE